MHLTKLAVLSFACLAAAEPAEANTQGILFRGRNYQGQARTIFDKQKGQCINLRGSLHEHTASIIVDRPGRDECILFEFARLQMLTQPRSLTNCRGRSWSYRNNNPHIRATKVSSVVCFRH
ncbi:hypothetical protein XA68_17884 [Ophiocordyceps unilateralis]|uniref:Beta/gamma crystallin 'Greek key' domain-containing protein n=1 Tax=Ophiocordyceps unilateralis TaxID=268505 RepID=A0A2A9PK44_OPHUN|nr:hypothetical protein XA68_17884 [Ophiocordyceps unilateralis]